LCKKDIILVSYIMLKATPCRPNLLSAFYVLLEKLTDLPNL
jgi:hypothetical protein